jgi:NAD+ diphosphatase
MQKIIKYCPNCTSSNLIFKENNMVCNSCNFTLFHNVASATAILIKYEDEILFVERNREPKKGFLDLPGGFVDYNETAEEGIIREVFEELQINITKNQINYIASFPNTYLYKDVLYHTLDLFFEVILTEKPKITLEKDEISTFFWINRHKIPLEKLAFDSHKRIINIL